MKTIDVQQNMTFPYLLKRITFYQAIEYVYTTLHTPSLKATPSVYCRYTEELPHFDLSVNTNYRSIKCDIQNLLEKIPLLSSKLADLNC